MNRKYFFLLLIFVLGLTFSCFAQTPGTSSDPLVTKSYLDFTSKFRKVELKSGTTITGESGALFVIMSGQLKVELKKGGMIVDLTTGRKITTSSNLQAYHLIMITDGSLCSFKATKDTNLMALGINDEDSE